MQLITLGKERIIKTWLSKEVAKVGCFMHMVSLNLHVEEILYNR